MKKLLLIILVIACALIFCGCPVPEVGDTDRKWVCETVKLYFDLNIVGDNGFYLNDENELITFKVEAETEYASGPFAVYSDQDVLPWTASPAGF